MADAMQRTILFWDVLRQRSDQHYAQKEKAVPHVLSFDAELVLDARTFEWPANYLMVRVKPLLLQMSWCVPLRQHAAHGRNSGAPGRSRLSAASGAAMGAGGAQAAALHPIAGRGGQWPLYFGKPTLRIEASLHYFGMVLIDTSKFRMSLPSL